MADILIRHAIVVTLDPRRRTIEDGAIAIENDRIVAVGPDAEVATKYASQRTIDATGMAAIPGLIDAHAHAGHGLIKTLGGGRSDLWYKACETVYTRTSTPEFWRAEAKLAALERLRFGVTTGVSLLGGGDTILRTDDPIFGDAHCDGVVSIGTRSVVAIGATRPPFPRTYAKRTAAGEEAYPVTFDRQLATCKTLASKWHDRHGKRIRIAAITPTLRAEFIATNGKAIVEEACAQAKTVRAFSRDNGLIFTQDGHTRGSVAFADRLGLLGPDALLSHATDLTEEEIKLTASTGTHIAHNPSAVASIMGRCPVPELLDAGANVALGSDGTAPDRSGDMFRHMQQCMHYHRRHFRDPSWLPPGRVLEMCTIDGAKALGMEKEVGSLEPGKKADVVLVDLRRPHLYPAHMPLFRIVCFANGNDVHTVIVDGVILLEDRRAVGVDENAVLDEAQREADLMIERAGLEALLETPATFWSHTRAPDRLRAH